MWNLINAETCVQTRSQRTEQHKRCWRGQDRRVVVILPRGGRVRCPENQKQARALARSCPQRPRHVSCRFQRHSANLRANLNLQGGQSRHRQQPIVSWVEHTTASVFSHGQVRLQGEGLCGRHQPVEHLYGVA
jgi:hypothetical protein